MSKYVIGIQIETDQPVMIGNVHQLVKDQLASGTAEVVSVEVAGYDDDESNVDELDFIGRDKNEMPQRNK